MYQTIKKMGNHKPDVKIQSKLQTLYINKREQLTKRYFYVTLEFPNSIKQTSKGIKKIHRSWHSNSEGLQYITHLYRFSKVKKK